MLTGSTLYRSRRVNKDTGEETSWRYDVDILGGGRKEYGDVHALSVATGIPSSAIEELEWKRVL